MGTAPQGPGPAASLVNPALSSSPPSNRGPAQRPRSGSSHHEEQPERPRRHGPVGGSLTSHAENGMVSGGSCRLHAELQLLDALRQDLRPRGTVDPRGAAPTRRDRLAPGAVRPGHTASGSDAGLRREDRPCCIVREPVGVTRWKENSGSSARKPQGTKFRRDATPARRARPPAGAPFHRPQHGRGVTDHEPTPGRSA